LSVIYAPPDEEAAGRPTQIRVRLADTSGVDRGLTVRLSLPLAPGEWAWMHDLDTAAPLGEEPLSNTTALRGLPGLPYFDDEAEKPEYGRYSTYPLGAVEKGGEYLALARDMRQLALVRFSAVGGDSPRLSAEVDLALSEFTDPSREAEFELIYVAGPAAEGRSMREALARTNRVGGSASGPLGWRDYGGWMPFADLGKIQNVDEFGFGFQEGGANASFDDNLGAETFVYFHCAGEFANVDGYERGSEPQPSYEDVVAAFEVVAKGHTGLEGTWETCGIQTAEGRIAYRAERTYGDFFCQACVDPDLPYGKAMADRLLARVNAEEWPAGIDGVYYDGIAAGLDYAPEHLRAADHLLLWDGTLGRPVNYNLWSSVEWARHIHEQLNIPGLTPVRKKTMLNDSSLASFPFVGPYIDVPGAEMSIYLRRDTCRLIRGLLGSKPFCTLVKGDFDQITQAQLETYMRRCTAYAILFGFFDITPSGANPGSSYWVHPEWYDRDRALFRRYMPVARELLVASWDAVPIGQITEGDAFVESFGPMEAPHYISTGSDLAEEHLQYLTLSTDPRADVAEAQAQRVVLDDIPYRGEADPKPPLLGVELLTGRVERIAGTLATEMTGEDLQVWAVGYPIPQARAALRRAADVAKRRNAYVSACREGREQLAPWAPYRAGASIGSPGRGSDHCLRVEKDEAGAAGATQTVTVNHEEPRDIVVSAWSKAEGVTGDPNNNYAVYVDCYYTDGTAIYGQTIEFATGTHDWERGEIAIAPEKPIRNINVYVLFRGGHTGTAYFDDVHVALAEAPEDGLLSRPGFEGGGEPRPLAGTSAEAERLVELCAQIGGGADARFDQLDWDARFAALDEMDQIVQGTDWGADTERARRDAEDLRFHTELAKACVEAKARPPQRASRLTELVALSAPRVTTGPKQYKATTGKMPQGTIVVVEGNFGGYTPTVLTDGKINPKTPDWTKVAWASNEHQGAHWIELRFPAPTRVTQIRLWAGLDGKTLHVPRQLVAE
ncbi:MAG TPA: hypothetical protein QGH10_00025, partial [Armatimonadota bacterium]|nr:hypothetical protein [Armatimonadota bacterium]